MSQCVGQSGCHNIGSWVMWITRATALRCLRASVADMCALVTSATVSNACVPMPCGELKESAHVQMPASFSTMAASFGVSIPTVRENNSSSQVLHIHIVLSSVQRTCVWLRRYRQSRDAHLSGLSSNQQHRSPPCAQSSLDLGSLLRNMHGSTKRFFARQLLLLSETILPYEWGTNESRTKSPPISQTLLPSAFLRHFLVHR